MKDSRGGLEMGLEIKPLWDPTGTVSVEVDDECPELIVRAEAEELRFVLKEDRADRLGWVEYRHVNGPVRRRRVSVGEVVCHCLREWEAEQWVLAMSRRAARRALARGGRWAAAGRRLADQTQNAPGRRLVSTLPFRVLLGHRSNAVGEAVTAISTAAQRSGYLTTHGRSDTQRLRRRAGVAGCRDGRGERSHLQRSVRYETGLALCRAVGVDPVELGL
jgi:hypothetical protein